MIIKYSDTELPLFNVDLSSVSLNQECHVKEEDVRKLLDGQ